MSSETKVKSDPVTLESLKVQVDKLVNQVKKNTSAIIDTGRHVLNIQIEHEKQLLAKEGIVATGKGKSKPAGLVSVNTKSYRDIPDDSDSDSDEARKSGDAITSEDIVELVTELQGQLDMLDERSVRRTANAFVSDDSDNIAPLPGRDGEFPSEEDKFPITLGEFKELDGSGIEKWLRWYELLPADEEELSQLLDKAGATLKDIGITEPMTKKVQATPEEVDANFDSLARFLGLRTRRTKGVW